MMCRYGAFLYCPREVRGCFCLTSARQNLAAEGNMRKQLALTVPIGELKCQIEIPVADLHEVKNSVSSIAKGFRNHIETEREMLLWIRKSQLTPGQVGSDLRKSGRFRKRKSLCEFLGFLPNNDLTIFHDFPSLCVFPANL